MKIRPYLNEDFPGVCRVYLDAKRDELRCEAKRIAITPLEDDSVISQAFAASEVIVLEFNGVVEGFLAYRGEELRALFVHSTIRGMGAGTALLAKFLESWQARVVVFVARSNRDALRFYERHGFQGAKEVAREYGGDSVVYLQLERTSFC